MYYDYPTPNKNKNKRKKQKNDNPEKLNQFHADNNNLIKKVKIQDYMKDRFCRG